MTKEKLKNIKKLRKAIDSLKFQIAEAESKATSATSGQWKRVTKHHSDGKTETFTVLRGMPRSPGSISAKVGTAAAEVADLHSELRKLERQRERLIAYVKAVDDYYIREIMTWHYVKERTWDETARKLGGNNTGDGVRIACERFLSRKKPDKTRFPRA